MTDSQRFMANLIHALRMAVTTGDVERAKDWLLYEADPGRSDSSRLGWAGANVHISHDRKPADDVRAEIRRLDAEGLTKHQISLKVNLSYDRVYRILECGR